MKISLYNLKDSDQFSIVYKTYYKELVVYTYGFVKSKEISEDLTQQLFVDLWEKRESITIHSNIKSFLFRAARNKAINHLTRNKTIAVDLFEAEENSISQEELEEEMLRIHRDKALYEIIEKLPEQRRLIFKSCYFEDKKYSETAQALGISINTVKTQMGRALRDLHKAAKATESFFSSDKK